MERKGLLALLGDACQSPVHDRCCLLRLAIWRILRESGQCLMTDLRGGVVLVGLGMYWALSMHRPCNNVFFFSLLAGWQLAVRCACKKVMSCFLLAVRTHVAPPLPRGRGDTSALLADRCATSRGTSNVCATMDFNLQRPLTICTKRHLDICMHRFPTKQTLLGR